MSCIIVFLPHPTHIFLPTPSSLEQQHVAVTGCYPHCCSVPPLYDRFSGGRGRATEFTTDIRPRIRSANAHSAFEHSQYPGARNAGSRRLRQPDRRNRLEQSGSFECARADCGHGERDQEQQVRGGADMQDQPGVVGGMDATGTIVPGGI